MSQEFVSFWAHIVSKLQQYLAGISEIDLVWILIGLCGQCLFMARFIVQWIHSERVGQSVVPISFWYFSLAGGSIVLAYGLHKLDPIIIIGQIPGTFVYARNLMLLNKNKSLQSSQETA